MTQRSLRAGGSGPAANVSPHLDRIAERFVIDG